MAPNDPNKKQHWHLLAFMYPGSGQWLPRSFMVSTPNKTLTVPYINAAKANNDVPDNSVLISISYIGHASTHDMRGTSDKLVPTKVSDAYRNGMQAALSGQADVVNPYLAAEGMPDQNLLIYEWADGFAAMASMKQSVA